MTKITVSEPTLGTSSSKVTTGRLFVLDLSGGRILSMFPDGSNQKAIVTGCRHPDGIVVDVEAGHIYWTEMGVPNLNDGSIERSGHRWTESQNDCSARWHFHAEADRSR